MPTLKVNDIDVYYELQGHGQPLVLIAGLGTDISPYRAIIRRLAQKYMVLAFDNRGVGRTDKPDIPYTIEMMANDTAGLLNGLGIKRADVLGISMGGRIALELTLQHPEAVRALVLASTSARVKRRAGSTPLIKLAKLLRSGGTMLGRSPQPYYAFKRQLEASGSYDCTDRLSSITAPTLILHGKKDRLAPYELAEEMHSGIRGSKLITFNGGHLFPFWEVDRFVSAISAFLGDVAGSA